MLRSRRSGLPTSDILKPNLNSPDWPAPFARAVATIVSKSASTRRTRGDDDSASRGKPNSGSAAFQQRQPEFIFELADPSGERRRIDAHLPSRLWQSSRLQ